MQTHLQNLIAELAREAAVTYSEELESLDHAAFYEGYLAATAEEVTEETAETDTSAESSGESK